MNFSDRAVLFSCEGESLVGVLSLPEESAPIGVVVVVGGPQYRVGSHRQFVLLARRLAQAGYPVLRFDYRGMGDSKGEERDFQDVDLDIQAAKDYLFRSCPSLKHVVLWGLCDAASAILLHCARHQDARLAGLCLLNPWVRSEATFAKAQVKHYYLKRLFQAEFWRKFLGGNLRVFASLMELFGALRRAGGAGSVREGDTAVTFQARMVAGLKSYSGPVLLILSGRDLAAKEFLEYAQSSGLEGLLRGRACLTRRDVPEADHTFSSRQWRGEVEDATLAFMGGIEGNRS